MARSRAETPRPESRKGRARVTRPLLGCGALILTTVSGYLAAQISAISVGQGHPRPLAINAPPSFESPIQEAAARYGVSAELIAAVIEVESQFNERAVSRRGARGLMQLMPATAATLGVDDPFDARANIHAGVRHLRSLMDRFDNNLPLVLAAYNAGERAVIVHRGIPPYPQTRAYVRRILRRLDAQRGDGPPTSPRTPKI